MRVLVEQTVSRAREWIEKVTPTYLEQDLVPPTASVLMGGEVETDWATEPEHPAVIVGTQDMLLSRALMRGYGMSRFQWPVHFGLLHNDALWVYDEVQLMGPGLSTSTQLEAFRREGENRTIPARSLWMSATLDPGWLQTIDFQPHLEALRSISLQDRDRELAADRLEAPKRLHPAPIRLESGGGKKGTRAYVKALVEAVLEAHRPDTQTLVILNRVSRAQDLFRSLRGVEGVPPVLLLHARFRPVERRGIEAELGRTPPRGRIVVATQAVEAGVDLSSATLFTEVAPWSSLVQRFGRCNRYGEVEGGSDVFWIDMDDDPEVTSPYGQEAVRSARAILQNLDSAGIEALPPVESPRELHRVLRRKDFLELFDTEPDLSGFDLDVSPYIRDPGPPQVQVFWRDFEDQPGDQKPPGREELCPVSMGQLNAYLKKTVRGERPSYWVWDHLEERWQRHGPGERPRPGNILMLKGARGGYDPATGFSVECRDPVREVSGAVGPPEDTYSGDPRTTVGRFLTLDEHTRHVVEELETLISSLSLPVEDAELLRTAGRWHDVGKAHPAFQTALFDHGTPTDTGYQTTTPPQAWAKSPGGGRLRYRIEGESEAVERPHFRHELASMLAWLEHGNGPRDLIAYLVASHHGKLRLALRALPTEPIPPDGRRFARGIWEGDELPALELRGFVMPPTRLRLEIMELGRGEQGPSWTERTRRLLEWEGPFRLGWLEALLRVADQRASAREKERTL
jgi:CRISPR-associated endonuclease/helicase Cas3